MMKREQGQKAKAECKEVIIMTDLGIYSSEDGTEDLGREQIKDS